MKGCARWHRQSSPQSGGETNIAVSSPLSGDGTSSSPLALNIGDGLQISNGALSLSSGSGSSEYSAICFGSGIRGSIDVGLSRNQSWDLPLAEGNSSSFIETQNGGIRFNKSGLAIVSISLPMLIFCSGMNGNLGLELFIRRDSQASGYSTHFIHDESNPNTFYTTMYGNFVFRVDAGNLFKIQLTYIQGAGTIDTINIGATGCDINVGMIA